MFLGRTVSSEFMTTNSVQDCISKIPWASSREELCSAKVLCFSFSFDSVSGADQFKGPLSFLHFPFIPTRGYKRTVQMDDDQR